MTWTPPTKPVNWQDTPSTSTALDAANLNADESFATTVGTSVVNYFEGGSSSKVPVATTFLTPSGGDDSATAATAIAAGGLIVLGPGTFLWNTQVPGISPATPTRIIGSGVGETTVKLSSGAPRFLDFGKTADYQVFSDIAISDLTVDANSIGGKHHVVIGCYINGGFTSRINVNRFALRRIKTLNVPSNSVTTSTFRPNVQIVPAVETADTACTLNDHVYEDLDFLGGGNVGLYVGAAVSGSPPSNLTYDRIYITRVKHDLGSPWGGTSGYTSANIQIGSRAAGGLVVIKECYGVNSGDVGIEVDNAASLVIRDTRIQDSFTTEYLIRNFNAPVDGDQKQRTLLDNCEARLVNQVLAEANSAQSTGFYLNNTGTPTQYGDFVLKDCKFVNTTALIGFGGNSVESVGLACHAAGPIRSITLDRFKVVAESLSLTPADGQQARIMALNPTGTSRVKIRDLRIRLAGSKSGGAGTQSTRYLTIGGTAGGDDCTFEIDGYDLDHAVTATSSAYGFLPGFIGGTIRGTIRRMKVIGDVPTTGQLSNAIFINSAPTISPRILVADCDFSLMQLNNAETSVPAIQRAFVYYDRNLWKLYPKPSVAMSSSNFNTGTFVTATGNQYIGGSSAIIQMTGGAAVTAIDLSKDGTTYDNIWTQASGALTQTVQFHVDNGDSVKVTFATTQPVVRVIPDK